MNEKIPDITDIVFPKQAVQLVNLTPHDIVIYHEDGETVKLVIKASGQVARATARRKKIGEINGIPVYRNEFSEVEGLPKPKRGVIYIVSSLVQQALKLRGIKRKDVVSPDTSPEGVVRDKNGRILGTKGFQII